ncbi:MAG: hypothetical protein GY746_05965, partial [Gammaproteobacteria bacterium]|nr:hypothetical protein [Gammaproteobacteria bacterium]
MFSNKLFALLLCAIVTVNLAQSQDCPTADPTVCWPVINTGNNHTVLVLTSGTYNLNGSAIPNGTYIGVFYDSAGVVEKCGGYTQWTGANTSIAAQGKDVGGDGFETSEVLKFKYLLASGDVVDGVVSTFDPVAVPFPTATNLYTSDAISRVATLNGTLILCSDFDSTINLITCDSDSVGTVIDSFTIVGGCDSVINTVRTLETTDPTATCQDITVQLDDMGSATITGVDVDGGSSDNCGIATLVAVPASFNCMDIGGNTVTLTVTDINGLTDECTSTVTVADTISPVALCNDLTIQLDASGNASITTVSTPLANSSADFSGTQGMANWEYGMHSAFDYAGFTLLPNWTTSVWNNPGTTLDFPQLDPNGGHPDLDVLLWAVRRWTSPISGNVTISGDFYDRDNGCGDGANVRIFKNGVQEMEFLNIPTAPTPYSITINVLAGDHIDFAIDPKFDADCDDTHFTAVINSADAVDAGSNDVCGIANLSLSQSAFTCADTGLNVVILTATDNNTNAGTCNANITVEDNIDPVALCQDITVNLDADGEAWVAATDVDAGSTDNCGIGSLFVDEGLDSIQVTCSDIGPNLQAMGVYDESGNYDSGCLITITVQDTIPPTMTCLDATVYLDASGQLTLNESEYATITDNCNTAFVEGYLLFYSCFNLGANQTNIPGYDGYNFASCNGTITVLDTIPPTAVCQNTTVYHDATGVATLDPSDLDGGSSDNCGVDSIAISGVDTFACNHGGGLKTLLVFDASGNVDSCSAYVNAQDTIPPTAGCQNITIYLDASGNANISPSDVEGGSMDNCEIESMQVSNDEYLCFDVGSQPVILTVGDDQGNSDTCTAMVTVADTIPPNAICQDVTVQLDASGNGSIDASDVNNGSTDNCDVNDFSIDVSDYNCSNIFRVAGRPVGNQVVLTATDENGNIDSCTANVTVMDTISPIALCQDITVALSAGGNGSHTATDINNGSSDACGIASLSASPNSYTCSELGANTSTLTVTDNNGNTSTCTSTVTVADPVGFCYDPCDPDLTDPTAVCQDITVQLNSAGNGSHTAADINDGSSDFCGIETISATPTTYTCANVGANTSTLTVTDSTGNVDSCTANVTVEDNVDPTVNCTDITVSLDAGGNYTVNTAVVGAGSSDACGLTLSASPASFSCGPFIVNDVTLTGTDSNGNADSCTALVTILDVTPPTASCVDSITVYLDATGTATITPAMIDNGSTDECAISLSVSPATFGCADIGITSTELGVLDFGFGRSSCTTVVTVLDTISPIIMCADTTVDNDAGECQAFVNVVPPVVVDNCDGSDTLDMIDGFGEPGSFITDAAAAYDQININVPAGSTVIGMTVDVDIIHTYVTDIEIGLLPPGGGLVILLKKPDGSCPDSNLIATFDDNATLTAGQLTNSWCNGTKPWFEGSAKPWNAFSTIAGASVNGLWTIYVTDAFNLDDGTLNSWSLNIIYNDPTGRMMETRFERNMKELYGETVDLSANASKSMEEKMLANMDNARSGYSLVNDYNGTADASDTYPLGTTTVNWTVTDAGGNTATCEQDITVEDNEAPNAVCQNITVYLDAAGDASHTADDIDGGSSDNCGQVTLTRNNHTHNCNDVGNEPSTLTVTDSTGNQSTCLATVAVVDTIAPNAVCTDVTVYLDGSGNDDFTTEDVLFLSTDNCLFDYTVGQTDFDCSDIGPNPVLVTIFDIADNTDTCYAIVTVVDTISPVAVCQDVTVQLDGTGNVSLDEDEVNNGSSDACGFSSITVNPEDFDCSDIGTSTTTLTVVDANGNTSTCSANVEVEDPLLACCTVDSVTLDLNCESLDSVIVEVYTNAGGCDSVVTYNLSSTTPMPGFFFPDDVFFNCDRNVRSDSIHAIQTQLIIDYLNQISAIDDTVDSWDIVSFNANPWSAGYDPFECTEGTGTYTFMIVEVDNDCGTQVFTNIFAVIDTIPPVAGCPADTTIGQSEDRSPANTGTATSIDACASRPATYSDVVIPGYCHDSLIIRTWVAIDDCGINGDTNGVHTDTCVQIITLVDDVAPVLNVIECDDLYVFLDASGNGTGSADLIIADNATDNCGIDSNVLIGQTSFTCSDIGNRTAYAYVIDNAGNHSDTCGVDLAVYDTISPVAVCPPLTIYLNEIGESGWSEATQGSGSSDNCGIQGMLQSVSYVNCTDLGGTTSVLTVSDASGNSSTCTSNITVLDTISPVALCQDLTIQLDATGNASITADDVDNGSSDACGIDTMTLNISSFTCSDIFRTVGIILTVTDVNGNSSTCSAGYTVLDTISPTAVCQDITVDLDGSGNGSHTASEINNGSNDNCGIASLSVSPNTYTCSDTGANSVTLTVTDVNSNISTCTATVTVADPLGACVDPCDPDLTDPTAVCQDITVELDSMGNASIVTADVDNGSSDLCGGVTLAIDASAFDCDDVGANTVTLTVTDGTANSSTCTATVSVEDNIAPVVTCFDATVYLDASGEFGLWNGLVSTKSDACGANIGNVSPDRVYCSDVGTPVPVTSLWIDANGNSASCIANVTVLDTISPTAICSNVFIDIQAGGSEIVEPGDFNFGSTDNCSVDSSTVSQTLFTCADLGFVPVVVTVFDQSGNQDTCHATVTVSDPLLACCDNDTTINISANCGLADTTISSVT